MRSADRNWRVDSRQSTRFTRRSARAEDTSASYGRGGGPRGRPGEPAPASHLATPPRGDLTAADVEIEAPGMAEQETFNPWTIVNVVFHHLADHGLHPVLGEAGDPAVPAAALLRAMGIEPGRNDETVSSPSVQDRLAEIRERMLGEA